MRKIKLKNCFLLLFAIFSLTACSDSDDGTNETGSIRGELTIDEETCYTEAENFSSDLPIDYNVKEKIQTTGFIIDAFRKGENLSNYYHFNITCDRINFDEIQSGDKLPITSGIVYFYQIGIYSDDIAHGYEGYPPLDGNVTFKGISDNNTLVHLAFNNVTFKTKGLGTGKEETHTINGTASFRRNEIMIAPDFPYADLTINGTKVSNVEVMGEWTVQERSKQDYILSIFNIPGVGYRNFIEMTLEEGDDLNSHLGKNLATLDFVNFNFKYTSGSISIIEVYKPKLYIEYPDITFKFEDFTISVSGRTYTINGTAKVVYEYTHRER